MDSRLLNTFHDDPFDENYTNYETNREIWSSEGDSIFNPADSFNDVMPMNITGEIPSATSSYYGELQQNTQNNELFNNMDKQNKYRLLNVNYNGDHQALENHHNNFPEYSYLSNNNNGNHNEETDDDDDDDDDDDKSSQCSSKTFRTRTDSSSIADYESHSSDYDEDDFEYHEAIQPDIIDSKKVDVQNLIYQPEENHLLNVIPTNLIENDVDILSNLDTLLAECESTNKNRTFSTNTLGSDADALSLNIDANNFDLAEFITKDDIELESSNNELKVSNKTIEPPSVFVVDSDNESDADSDSGSDSDVIVDVENLAVDEEMELKKKLLEAASLVKPNPEPAEDVLSYTDNAKADPSWCPSSGVVTRKNEKSNASQTSINSASNLTLGTSTNVRNYPSLIPSKKQSDVLKRFGCGRGGKNLLAQRNAKIAAKKMREHQQKKQQNANSAGCPVVQRGKNLALLKQKNVSISEMSSEETISPTKSTSSEDSDIVSAELKEKDEPLLDTKTIEKSSPLQALKIKKEIIPQSDENQERILGNPAEIKSEIKPETLDKPQETSVPIEEPPPKPLVVKRKLNLEEYKMKRRGESFISGSSENKISKPIIHESSTNTNFSNNSKSSSAIHLQSPKKNMALKPESSEAVKSIVKTLKEEQQKPADPLDPIIQAKNKVLRMQELKKAQQLRIIDSTISKKVPRVTKLLPLKDIVNDIYPIEDDSNKYHKVDPIYEEITIISTSCNTIISIPPNKSFETSVNPRSLLKNPAQINITTNSLLASIQNEVVKKSQESNMKSIANQQNEVEYQGEDKVIMHLRKDRIRKQTSNACTQTDLTPQFSLLPKPKEMKRRKSRSYRHKRSSCSDSEESSSRDSSPTRSHSRCNSRSRSGNYSVLESLRTPAPESIAGGYSSRSSRRHRSSLSSSSGAERKSKSRQRKRRYSFKKSSKRSNRSHSRSSSTSSSGSLSEYSESDKKHRRHRTRSRSPLHRGSRSRTRSRSRSRSNLSSFNNNRNSFVDRNVSQPAVEERRIVYVGRIEEETTKELLRRKFLAYGNVKQVTVHYKENGMKYGFVTFERSQDAFQAIDNCLRDPQISMYDVSFGGRRAFCRASYSDLDNAGINTYESYVFPKKAAPAPKADDSFEALLLQVKAKLNANKSKPNEENNKQN